MNAQQIGPRLLNRDARLETSDPGEVPAAAGGRVGFQRQPYVDLVGKHGFGRQYANDCVGALGDLQYAAENRRVAAKCLPPQRVADQDHGRLAARLVVFGCEVAAEGGLEMQDVEQIPGDLARRVRAARLLRPRDSRRSR